MEAGHCENPLISATFMSCNTANLLTAIRILLIDKFSRNFLTAANFRSSVYLYTIADDPSPITQFSATL